MIANWPAPSHIYALTTTRMSGRSKPPYDRNNLALHVGDDEEDVYANRQAMVQALRLPNEPVWLEQTHSNRCVVVEEDSNRMADAAITRHKAFPLAIMTADCLPIVLCNQEGKEIAAIHAGWRGLIRGIIENTLEKMKSSPETLLAWIGPAICQACFEVGDEVRQAFTHEYPMTEVAFRKQGSRWLAHLVKMAKLIFKAQGVMSVYHAEACTVELEKQFYSYRRAAQTGRMATLIWFKQDN